jgi:hypothetical protein
MSPLWCALQTQVGHHDMSERCQQSDVAAVTKTLLPAFYENLPHARSVTHQMSLLPSKMTQANANQP